MKNILIVDDESDYFEILSNCEKKYNFFQINSLKKIKDAIKSNKIDLILLDWDLKEEYGIDCLSELKSNFHSSKIPVIMLTGRSSESDIVNSLSLGADDFISKPVSLVVLDAKINANLRKYHLNNKESELFIHNIHFDENCHCITICNNSFILRKKEFEILKCLASNPDKVFSRHELNAITTGQKIFVSERTIDTFIAHIRNKIPDFNLITTVSKKGYKFNLNFHTKEPQ